MTGTAVVASPAGRRWQAARWPIRLLAVFAVLGSLLAFTQTAMAATASDNFNRANGALGASWTKISDGALTISGQAVAGTAAANYSGDLWTASTFGGNQFSQVTTTSTQLTGGQWIAVAVRANSTGQQAYVGLYFWNNGSPDMRLYRRNGGTWTQLGSTYSSGPLAAGSQLQIRAVGSTISLMQNGTTRISVTDTTLTSGAPGIYAYGKGRADNWTGGDVSTYSVGGTVSGLSGSVVLQDNGGDNLTVSANGILHLRHQTRQRRRLRRHRSRPTPPARPAPSPTAPAPSPPPTSPTSPSPAPPTHRPPIRSAGPCPACPAAWSCRTTAATT